MKIGDSRRLGNLLFNYASLLGIAQRNNYIPVVQTNSQLRDHFQLGMHTGPAASWFNSKVIVYSDNAYEYDNRTDHLDESFNKGLFSNFHNTLVDLFPSALLFYDYALDGFFQTFKLFRNVEKDLRQTHFQFKNHIKSQVDLFFKDKVPNVNTGSKKETIYVGVHIRRGDMASTAHLINFGYTLASASYLFKAMEYYKKQFSDSKVIFIVCTDDQKWYTNNIAGKSNATLILSTVNDPVVDLGILARCNHSIITVGSFGWWSAWLAGGKVVYYADWPRKGSELDQHYIKHDYFPEEWIGLE